jgi:PIF1-like helicase
MFELTEIMRQRDDLRFAVALNNLARGCLTEEEVELFRSRCFKVETDLPENVRSAIHLFSTNAEVERHNTLKMAELPTETIEVIAVDGVSGSGNAVTRRHVLGKMRAMTTAETFGLPYKLEIKVGARVMLTKNLDIEDGLFNGASGILVEVSPNENQANTFWIHFDGDRIGQKARRNRAHPTSSHLTPISKESAEFPVSNSGTAYGTRRQFPIVAAEAITVHKAQGQTLDSVVVGVGRWFTRNACYVAFSRSRTLAGLHIVGSFNPPPPPSATDPTVLEMARLRNNAMIPKFARFADQRPANQGQAIFFNVQSLRSHLEHINSDEVFRNSEVLLFAETWFNNLTTPVAVTTHTEFARQNMVTTRPSANGTTIFVKNEFSAYPNGPGSKGHYFGRNKISASWLQLGRVKFIVVYKSPTTSIGTLKGFMETILTPVHQTTIVCGDFNLASSQNFVSFMEKNFSLIRIATSPTTSANTTIDLVFVTADLTTTCTVEVYESMFSHHKPLLVRFKP